MWKEGAGRERERGRGGRKRGRRREREGRQGEEESNELVARYTYTVTCSLLSVCNYGQRSYCATASKEKFQPSLTVVRGRCSWLLSTLGGPPHDHGRNSSRDPGVGAEEERE